MPAWKGPMKQRHEQAMRAASAYAPPPQSSALTYGLVSTTLACVILWGLARFYNVALVSHVVLVGVSLIIALVLGIWLRNRRKRRHRRAVDVERVRLG